MQDYLEFLFEKSSEYYVSGHGTILVQLDEKDKSQPPSHAFVLITEHRPLGSEQYNIAFTEGHRVSRNLPAGEYSVVVAAPGIEPYRTDVDIPAGEVTTVIVPPLEPSQARPQSFDERIAKLGLDTSVISVRPLEVDKNCTYVLDPDSSARREDVHPIPLENIDQVKTLLGVPDKYWPTERPRFGNMFPREPSDEDVRSLTFNTRGALREYVYGNSKSVNEVWKSVLNQYISAEAVVFPWFIFSVVTVGPNAVLQVGAQGLSCDILRVHTSGTVKVEGAGPTKVETGTYESFF